MTLGAEVCLHEAAATLVKNEVGSLPVVDAEGQYLGLFTEQSCMLAFMEAVHGDVPAVEVDAFLDSDALTVGEDAGLVDIAGIFTRTNQRCLAVLRDGKPIGIVSRCDVIKAVAKYLEAAPDTRARTLYLSALRGGDEQPPRF